ncbi:MAG: sodium/solute symporter [Anaerovoracaceae bacterium]|nr:sodium/solute symporter [Anaerovoracaceae bacterium]
MFSSFAWIVISFVICIALVSYISYVKTKGSDLETSNGYFLGGNSFAGIVICASLVMTDLSAEQLVGNNGQSVFVGMGVWAAQGTFWTGLVIAALIILPALLNAGVITLPQFFEKRFDKATRTIIAIVMILSYIICFLPAALYAGAQIFVNLIGVDEMLGISNFTAIVLVILMLLAIGLAYVLLGGMRAIAMSDTVFGFAMFGLGAIIPIACMVFLSNQLGGDGSFIDGLDKFINTRPEMMNAWNEWNSNAPWWPWPIIITGLVVNNVYFAGANQTIIQRALGGKSLAAAQKGMILAGLVDFFSPIFLVIPGIVAALAWPSMDFGNGDAVFGTISNAIIPTWFVGIYAAVIFGAILSTVNGLINSIQTMFAMDVYKQYINKEADDSKCVKVGRRFAIVVARAFQVLWKLKKLI